MWAATSEIKTGDRVETIGCTPEDSDKGTILAILGSDALVGWESGVRTVHALARLAVTDTK